MMEKEVIEAIFEEAVQVGGDYYEIDSIRSKFYELLEKAYKVKQKAFLSQFSEEALKLIDKEITKEKL